MQIKNANLDYQSLESRNLQWLGENINKLMVRMDVESLQIPLLKFVTHKMTIELDLFGPFMNNGVAAICRAVALSQVMTTMAWYLDFVEDQEIACCFLDFQEIEDSHKKTQKPVVC